MNIEELILKLLNFIKEFLYEKTTYVYMKSMKLL